MPDRQDRRIVEHRPLRAPVELDAAGHVLAEQWGNGVTRATAYDVAGRPSRLTLSRAGTALYDATLARNAWGAISTVTDTDGHGLDHSATFAYDGAARLVDATMGAGAAANLMSPGSEAPSLSAIKRSAPNAIGTKPSAIKAAGAIHSRTLGKLVISEPPSSLSLRD